MPEVPGNWEKVELLFHQALDRPADERHSFVEQACHGDSSLRDEVLSLLLQADETGTLMGTQIEHASRSIAPGEGDAFTGKRIGPYRISYLIGTGGMAEVYCAIRDDEQYQKQVAIKLIRNSAALPFLFRRFRHERQILASLEHVCIARFLEGGTTEDGIPYFVMEYIEGAPITDYCEKCNLPVAGRLELFRSVCDAVQYAHRNLVIHRDLKPSNILVTAEGIPKLLDFGIAKLLNPETGIDEALPAQTVTSFRIMTPEYASPEQVRGDAVTTATDVYSLGVVLYEMLTTQRPHQFKARSLSEIERKICETDPDRPSAAVLKTATTAANKKLSRELARDLDNIVMMAMHKEPQHRYQTVEQLSRDITHYLEGRPVSARTPTFSYRAGKMLRRHKVAAVGIFLFIAVAVLFMAGILRERNRSEAARARAEHETKRAKAVNEFLQSTLSLADPFGDLGPGVTIIQAVQASAEQIQGSFKNDPEIEADVRDTIGYTFLRLGKYDEAEKHLNRSLELRKKLYGANHEDVAHSLNNLATLFQEKGDLTRSEQYFRQAVAIRKHGLKPESAETASSLNDLAVLLRDEGKIDEAEKLQREALEIRRKILGPQHEDVATSLNNLASILYSKGDLPGAESMFREVLNMDRKRWGEEHPNVAVTMNNLAFVMEKQGKLPEAENLYRNIVAMNSKLLGRDHPLTATSLNNLGGVMLSQSRLDEAEQLFRQSLRIRRRVLPAAHPHLAISLNNLGQVLLRTGRCAEAEPNFREALSILSASDFDPARKSAVKSNLGDCLATLKRYPEAEMLLKEAYSEFIQLKGAESKECREAHDRLNRMYDGWGKPENKS